MFCRLTSCLVRCRITGFIKFLISNTPCSVEHQNVNIFSYKLKQTKRRGMGQADWITLKGCTVCTDIIHLKLFDFMISSVISAIQAQSRAAINAHRVQTVWQHELHQRNVETVLHQILCKSWKCSSNAFKHGKDNGSWPKCCLIAIHTCMWMYIFVWMCVSLCGCSHTHACQ